MELEAAAHNIQAQNLSSHETFETIPVNDALLAEFQNLKAVVHQNSASAPHGYTSPAPKGYTSPAPKGYTSPAPKGHTAPASKGATSPLAALIRDASF